MNSTNYCGFVTRFEIRGAHEHEEQWYAGDTRVYIGSGLCEDKNHISCVRQCIMIHWDRTPSTPPFIG
jgi:hypothetical protein